MNSEINIRTLNANEIDVRVQMVKENGYLALLYKDARADMKLLDETFGTLGWQRHHEIINGNLFCTVSIWDNEKKQWISKQDVGVESNTEKEKGQASDSFKRACFNIGIGRELYTSPFIWISPKEKETYSSGNSLKLNAKVKFKVSEIEYNENREITKLKIVDQDDFLRFTFNSENKQSRAKQNSAMENKIENPTSTKQPYKADPNSQIGDVCAICNTSVNSAVKAYSNKNFGQTLCREHQTDENKII